MGWRDHRGQTMTEYLGGLLIVSVLIAAVGGTSVGEQIRDRMQRLVCEIAGGAACFGPNGPADDDESLSDRARELREWANRHGRYRELLDRPRRRWPAATRRPRIASSTCWSSTVSSAAARAAPP